MNAVRFGSYSSRSTVAGTLNFRRLKSTMRYDCLWPPPRNRLVMRPWLLRPPEECCPSVRTLTGLPLHSSLRSTRMVPRRLAVTGLKCFSAIAATPGSGEAGGQVDGLTRRELDIGFLHVAAPPRAATEPLRLALVDERVHAFQLHAEQSLDGCRYLRLGRLHRHLKHDRVLLAQRGRLLGDHRPADHRVHRLARNLHAWLRPARGRRCCVAHA